MATRKYRATASQIQEILEFAIANSCVISPLGYEDFLEGFNEFGHCVCDRTKTRVHCPCTEAPREITEKGKCLCGLYYRDYPTYMSVKKIGEV